MESEAYNLGWDAFNDRVPYEDNPYSSDEECNDWERGWYAARAEAADDE